MIRLDNISLPPDLWWSDEIDWTPVAQNAAFSLDGALVVEESLKRAGRPITLRGHSQRAWVPRETVLALQNMAAEPDRQMLLQIHDQQFIVIFRHVNGSAFQAESLRRLSPPLAADSYILTLHFLVVDTVTTEAD